LYNFNFNDLEVEKKDFSLFCLDQNALVQYNSEELNVQ